MNPLEDAESSGSPLDELITECEQRAYDWGMKAETAAQCGWSVEVRVTPTSVLGEADESRVFYAVGGLEPAARMALFAALTFVRQEKSQ